MSLSTIVVPQHKIELSNGDNFLVRGLCFQDTAVLLHEYGADLNDLFAAFMENGEVDLGDVDMRALAPKLVATAPKVVAKIIALAADEPDQVDTIRKLPFPVQADALEQIGVLTFTTPDSVKKTVDTVIKMLRGTGDAVTDLTTSGLGSTA